MRWLGLVFCFVMACGVVRGQATAPQLVLIDTDIGDDVDDAFALGLALASPELKIVGITSARADTALKARMLDRLLCETGRSDIPVGMGIKTAWGPKPLSQAQWGQRMPEKAHADGVELILQQIRLHPHDITLLVLGTLTNVRGALERDPETFHKLKRIVMMGGSIRRGYGQFSFSAEQHPSPEANIAGDVPAAQAIFQAGVPLYVLPYDSTAFKLDAVKQELIFTRGTNLTDALALLYHQWSAGYHLNEPTLYDVMPVAFAVRPELCPVSPVRIEVDNKGYTRVVPGAANSFLCMTSSSDAFFDFFMPRILEQKLYGSCEKKP